MTNSMSQPPTRPSLEQPCIIDAIHQKGSAFNESEFDLHLDEIRTHVHDVTYDINDPCSSSNILAKELNEALNLKDESRVISWDTAIARADLLTENVQLLVEDIQGTDCFDLHFEVMDLSHLQ